MNAPESERSYLPPAELEAVQTRAWWVAGVGILASAAGFLLDPTQFYRSYLVAWLFWMGIALGCLAVLMLHHLTRGAWGLMVRRTLEAAAGTLPALGLLFVPLLVGMAEVWVWARPEVMEADELLQHKQLWLNPAAFAGRSIAYLLVWIGFALALIRASRAQDETGDRSLFRRMRVISAIGLPIYCLLATFAAVDWLMSLDPHWYSSLFGVYFVGGHGVAAFAFLILPALWLSRREPLAGVLAPKHFHDYGKLLLAFVMLWAYFALSQLLIIWSAHLPEEIGWYIDRVQGGWKWVSIALVLLHFLLPFLLLLSRDIKRSAGLLAGVAAGLLVMRWFDLFWLAAPAFHHGGLHFHWLDLATVAAVGGLWTALFARTLRKRSLLPLRDPALQEGLAHE